MDRLLKRAVAMTDPVGSSPRSSRTSARPPGGSGGGPAAAWASVVASAILHALGQLPRGRAARRRPGCSRSHSSASVWVPSKRPGFDSGAPQRAVDLFGDPGALDRRVAMRRPHGLAARVGGQVTQLARGVLGDRRVGDRDPPARRHRGLLGAGGGDHRLPGRFKQPLARLGELARDRRRGPGRRRPSVARSSLASASSIGTGSVWA